VAADLQKRSDIETPNQSTRFQRLLLPAFAFKAAVIGGGYATGRELAEFFLPSGPRGGVLAMFLVMVVWSLIATVTFLFSQATKSLDYRTFFQRLLGPAWFTFEVAYVCMVLLFLSVFAAAAGAVGASLFGWPTISGTLLLVFGIAWATGFGNLAVERLFKFVSIFLYVVYAIFVVLACTRFWSKIVAGLSAPVPTKGWVYGGLVYSAYNIVSAVVILPTLRHLKSPRDALLAGLLCGPLAMLPALLFFVAMAAFYPAIGKEVVPADFMLRALDAPVFRIVFQLMIFAALLESGTGFVHAINERIASALKARGITFRRAWRLSTSWAIFFVSVFVAARFGLVSLIASGYRALAYVVIVVYVLPLLTYGVWWLNKNRRRREPVGQRG
jgi:uncharacterized membrane protein YkvI